MNDTSRLLATLVGSIARTPDCREVTFESGDVRYATSGDVHIGYRVFGGGPLDIVFVSGLTSNLDSGFWAPEESKELDAIGRIARGIIFDKRGTGISDRVSGAPSLEERMDDVRAVMDGAGSTEAVVYGKADGAALAVLFAATYPERTIALILGNPRPRFTSTPDYPWAPTREEYDRTTEEEVRVWGRARKRGGSPNGPVSSRTSRRWSRLPVGCALPPVPAQCERYVR